MALDHGCYIDQSQSLNIYMDQPNFGKLTSLHFHAWSKVSTLVLHKYEIWNQLFCVHNYRESVFGNAGKA
jgi:hypothetical protein